MEFDKNLINSVINVSCLDFMQNCSPETFDAVITDPPYESGYDRKIQMMDAYDKKQGKTSNRTKEGYTEFQADVDYDAFAKLLYKVLKDKTWCVIFSADHQTYEWRQAMEKAGFKFRQFRIWKKRNVTLSLSPYRTALQHEIINVYSKGAPPGLPAKRRAKGSIIEMATPNKRYHPTQKPVNLLIRLVEDYTKEGDLVFEPFSGSGSTLKACILKGRNAIGCELIPKYVELANNIIKELRQNKWF